MSDPRAPLGDKPDPELCFLGSIPLLDTPGEQAAALLLVEPHEIAGKRNRIVFGAMQAITARGAAIDSVVLFDELTHLGYEMSDGTAEFIADMLVYVPHPLNVSHYALMVREGHVKRTAVGGAREAVRLLSSPTGGNGSTVPTLEDARERIDDALRVARTDSVPVVVEGWPEFPSVAWRGTSSEWLEWQRGTTEAPDSYHFAAWMTSLGFAIGKNAWAFSGLHLYPQFMVALAGPPGSARKSTVISRTLSMCRILRPDMVPLAGWGSGEGALLAISKMRREDAHVFAIQSELMVMLRKCLGNSRGDGAAGGGANLICEMYDGADATIENTTRSGRITVERLMFHLMGGVTHENCGKLYSDAAIESGLSSRFVCFLGRTDLCIPIAPAPNAERGKRMSATLGERAATAAGERRMDADAEEIYGKWYRSHRASSDDGATSRLPGHALRLALIYSVDRGGRSIDVGDITAACAVADWWGACARFVRDNWGSQKVRHLYDRILAAAGATGVVGITVAGLKRALGGGHLNMDAFTDAWKLVLSHRAVRQSEDGKRWVRA